MDHARLSFLLEQVRLSRATPGDLEELLALIREDAGDEVTSRITTFLQAQVETGPGTYDRAYWQTAFAEIMAEIKPAVETARVPLVRLKWLRYAAAAAVLLLAAATYFLNTKNKTENRVATRPALVSPDIAPGGNKAILYLAGGQKIILDSAKNGQLARLGGATVTKTDSGKLIYAAAENNISEPASLNTLQTPRGGIFQITLPDGSQAWLNAESSITYPTRFNKSARNVSITGEVYFEVAKDVAHPFIVSLPAMTRTQGEAGHWMQVEVLGTHFNINAYNTNEDGLAKTTLLEGSVKVSAHGEAKTIRPGEQTFTSFSGTAIGLTKDVDLDKVMAWKNGKLSLTSSSVEQVMQEISRWYDVDIKYQGTIPSKQFYGSIHRNVPLSSVLNALKAYGVNARLEGKTIIVQ